MLEAIDEPLRTALAGVDGNADGFPQARTLAGFLNVLADEIGAPPRQQVLGNLVEVGGVFVGATGKRGLFEVFPHDLQEDFALGAAQLHVVGATPFVAYELL